MDDNHPQAVKASQGGQDLNGFWMYVDWESEFQSGFAPKNLARSTVTVRKMPDHKRARRQQKGSAGQARNETPPFLKAHHTKRFGKISAHGKLFAHATANLKIDVSRKDGSTISIPLKVLANRKKYQPNSHIYDNLAQQASMALENQWQSLVTSRPSQEASRPTQEESLLIAYSFGMKEKYVEVASRITVQCAINEQGSLLEVGTDVPLDRVIPPHAAGAIKKTRLHIIDSILEEVYRQRSTLQALNSCQVGRPDQCENPGTSSQNDRSAQGNAISGLNDWNDFIHLGIRQECAFLNYEALASLLEAEGLWPPVSATSIRMSVYELTHKLYSIITPTMTADGEMHRDCGIGFTLWNGTVRIVNQMPEPVSDEAKRAMELHAKKFEPPCVPVGSVHDTDVVPNGAGQVRGRADSGTF
ncbi:hypothetical protein BU24DRAFT_140241 [Aaosphaeria arxii CBS 175.79]|uniref:Uncharacterized protein n=1 Tax=Aaosphaeria arxii CBS 175.79 TaxID=1450172 RepID=A0A6A5XVC3_9PLEO|nr:uncharacterized protein BU24DRAFT_140241 [Aaosphaeria arxii CBS 175.79]KAF2016886.1 hypothetical protein BU24DRAFT_140241 [Aaosphaeria arxii CBS 175.79]